jgi:hypothetical protein
VGTDQLGKELSSATTSVGQVAKTPLALRY